MWAKPLYICKKGVAALAPKASLKWLGRTPGGGPSVLRHLTSSKSLLASLLIDLSTSISLAETPLLP